MGKGTFVAIAVLLPLLGGLLYLQLGEPDLLKEGATAANQSAQGHQAGEAGSVEEMIQRLTNRLK